MNKLAINHKKWLNHESWIKIATTIWISAVFAVYHMKFVIRIISELVERSVSYEILNKILQVFGIS